MCMKVHPNNIPVCVFPLNGGHKYYTQQQKINRMAKLDPAVLEKPSAQERYAVYKVPLKKDTHLCTEFTTMLDCHCARRPFRRMPLHISSTGPTASRSHQATTRT